jgi:PAS domain S-box-containing protein
MLHIALWALFVLSALVAPVLAYIHPDNLGRYALQTLCLQLICVGLLALTRQGRVRSAATLLVGFLWTYFMTVAVLADGVRAQTFMGALVLIVMAGMWLGARAAAAVGILNILAGLALLYADARGLLPRPSITQSPASVLVIAAFFSCLLVVILKLGAEDILEALHRARTELAERRLAERALRESEERYRRVTEQASDAIIITNAEGIYTDVNARGCQMLGLPREAIIGQPVGFVLEPEERARLAPVLQEVRAGRTILSEWRSRRPDGTPLRLEVSASRLADGRLLGIVRDITERRRAEEIRETLRDLARQLTAPLTMKRLGQIVAQHCRRLFAHDAFLLYTVDPRTGERAAVHAEDTPEGASEPVPVATDFAAGTTPLVRRVFEGSPLLINRSSDDPPEADDGTWGFAQRRSRSLLFMPLLWEGRCVGVITVQSYTPGKYTAHDLELLQVIANQCGGAALRVLGELALRESEERFSRLVGASFEGISITEGGVILDANEQLARMLGYELAELIGKLVLDTVAPEARHVVQQHMSAGAEGPYESLALRKDGSTFYTEIRARPLPYRGRLARVAAIHDISERKEAERLHASLEAQLRHAQKMEAVGQLAAGVAHDFNNVLTVIQGNALLLRGEPLTPLERTTTLDQIVEAAQRAANLTRQLLTFSRRQLTQSRAVDLNEVVGHLTRLLQRLIGEHIALESHYAAGGAPVRADTGLIEQALINLAVNSRDAMPDGGKLTLTTAAVTLDEAAASLNPLARPGEFIRLTVRDTGSGVAPEHLPRLFEPFFTTKDIGKGTGLGLATVFAIVQQHKGWIEVESTVGLGTSFHLYLPRLTGAPTPSNGNGDTTPARPAGGTEAVLLVEDEAPVRKLARTILERGGYRIFEAEDGPAALQTWTEHQADIRLLLSDMVMPGGLSGRQLAERLLAQAPGLKVILTSGYSSEVLGRDFKTRRGLAFVPKPYEPATLLQTVRDCLDGK